jgi:hypothetical protein
VHAEHASGKPEDWPSWSAWSYGVVELELLTLAEVNERLALELFVQNTYGIAGTL